MAKYRTAVKNLGEMMNLPTDYDNREPLGTHRAIIRAIKLLYPEAEVNLFSATLNNGRVVETKLDPMPSWTR